MDQRGKLSRIDRPKADARPLRFRPVSWVGNEMLFITARTSLYGVTRQPDLVVTGVRRFPTSPRRGQLVLFSATVKNQGTAPTPAGTPVRVAFTIGASVTFTWASVSNNIYHVACKGGFSELGWNDVSPAITASNAVTSWTTAVPAEASLLLFRVRVGP